MGLRLLRPFFQVFRCVTGLRRWLSFGFWRKGGSAPVSILFSG